MRFCSAVLVLAMAACTNLSGQTKSPSVHFDKTSSDMGAVPQGTIIRQVFSFTNKGPGTLEILNVGHS